jgi:hypothetical protein
MGDSIDDTEFPEIAGHRTLTCAASGIPDPQRDLGGAHDDTSSLGCTFGAVCDSPPQSRYRDAGDCRSFAKGPHAIVCGRD